MKFLVLLYTAALVLALAAANERDSSDFNEDHNVNRDHTEQWLEIANSRDRNNHNQHHSRPYPRQHQLQQNHQNGQNHPDRSSHPNHQNEENSPIKPRISSSEGYPENDSSNSNSAENDDRIDENLVDLMPFHTKVIRRLNESEQLSDQPLVKSRITKMADELFGRCKHQSTIFKAKVDRHCAGRATGQIMRLIATVEKSNNNFPAQLVW